MSDQRLTRDTWEMISLHGYCDILALGRTNLAHLLGFCDDVVEPSPITWDEFGATARRSTRMEDKHEIGSGVVGP